MRESHFEDGNAKKLDQGHEVQRYYGVVGNAASSLGITCGRPL